MLNDNTFMQFKAAQREGWALFVPLEAYTTPASARLVERPPHMGLKGFDGAFAKSNVSDRGSIPRSSTINPERN